MITNKKKIYNKGNGRKKIKEKNIFNIMKY